MIFLNSGTVNLLKVMFYDKIEVPQPQNMG